MYPFCNYSVLYLDSRIMFKFRVSQLKATIGGEAAFGLIWARIVVKMC